MAGAAPDSSLLTNRSILKLADGLALLDGVVDGGKACRFEWDSDTAWILALDTEAVSRAKLIYERALKSLGARLGVVDKMAVTPENAANVAAYLDQHEQLLDQTQDMSCLHSYSRSVLQKKNKIPPSVLANLLPVLKDE